MSVAWYPSIWQNWYMSADENNNNKKEIEPFLIDRK